MMVIYRIGTQPQSYTPTARLFCSRLLQELRHISLPELYFDNLSVCRYVFQWSDCDLMSVIVG